MAPLENGSSAQRQTIYLVRHGKAINNETPSNVTLRDPGLTDMGLSQARSVAANFPFFEKIDLLCASPLWRTLQTASIVFDHLIKRKGKGMKIIALPDAQEASDSYTDTGSERRAIEQGFGEFVDFTEVKTEDWYKHEGDNATDTKSLLERARRLRCWLRNREENEIVVVTHSMCMREVFSPLISFEYSVLPWLVHPRVFVLC